MLLVEKAVFITNLRVENVEVIILFHKLKLETKVMSHAVSVADKAFLANLSNLSSMED